MISRKNTILLAEIIAKLFTLHKNERQPSGRGYKWVYVVETYELYEYLYENDYPAWFCNLARLKTGHSETYWYATRDIKDFILKLHTGETQATATPNWTWAQREKLGQQYLKNLAEDILNTWHLDWCNQTSPRIREEKILQFLRKLELDGYVYQNERLLSPEEDVLNVEKETNLLEILYNSLELGNSETAFHHLALSAEHYEDGLWEDSISNSRKFLECVLKEIALRHSAKSEGVLLDDSVVNWPVKVRGYLENAGLLESKETLAIANVYALLSHTGSHPYMAEKDQARLLRHLSLTFSQFAMLRFQGSLAFE